MISTKDHLIQRILEMDILADPKELNARSIPELTNMLRQLEASFLDFLVDLHNEAKAQRRARHGKGQRDSGRPA